MDLVGQLLGAAAYASYLGEVEDYRQELRVVASVGPGGMDHQRDPRLLDHDGVLGAEPAAVHGARAGRRATSKGTDRDAVDDHGVEVELAGPLEQAEQVGLEPVPDPGLLPGSESPMGGAAGAAQLLGDVLPSGAGGQGEPDHPEGGAVPDPGPASLGADGRLRWQVMGDSVEEFVRHMGGGHGDSPQDEGRSTDGAKPMPRGFCQSL